MKILLSFSCLAAGLLLQGCVLEPVPRYRIRETRPAGASSEEILKMSKSGLSDDVILLKIKEDGLASKPTADQLKSLKEEGVSDTVLKAMVRAPVTGPEQRVVEYVYYPRSSYYPYYYPYSWGYPYGYYGWPAWGWHQGYYWR
jgi:hypothetical protein